MVTFVYKMLPSINSWRSNCISLPTASLCLPASLLLLLPLQAGIGVCNWKSNSLSVQQQFLLEISKRESTKKSSFNFTKGRRGLKGDNCENISITFWEEEKEQNKIPTICSIISAILRKKQIFSLVPLRDRL